MNPAASFRSIVMKSLRAALLVSLLRANAVAAPREEGPPPNATVAAGGEKAVLTLAAAVATKFSLGLCRYGQLRYDAKQTPGHFALLRGSKAAPSGPVPLGYAIFQHSGKTWTFHVKEAGPWIESCHVGHGDRPRVEREDVTSVELRGLAGEASKKTLSFFAGELAVVLEDDGEQPATRDDWATLRHQVSAPGPHGVEDRELPMTLILDRGSPLEKTLPKIEPHVAYGKANGTGDADIDVAASLRDGDVVIDVDVADDKDVPLVSKDGGPASNADFLRSDHVELWWQAGVDKGTLRQLGIALLKDGTVASRWLYPKEGAGTLPKVSSPARGKYRVEVPATALFQASTFQRNQRHEVAFTAAFSDTDKPGKRQETFVATSALKWGNANTFGALVWLPNGARFPPPELGSKVELTVTDRK
ncbi:MAG TPA: hypothetical protein VGG33_01435 [Polyangia bacterium]